MPLFFLNKYCSDELATLSTVIVKLPSNLIIDYTIRNSRSCEFCDIKAVC